MKQFDLWLYVIATWFQTSRRIHHGIQSQFALLGNCDVCREHIHNKKRRRWHFHEEKGDFFKNQ